VKHDLQGRQSLPKRPVVDDEPGRRSRNWAECSGSGRRPQINGRNGKTRRRRAAFGVYTHFQHHSFAIRTSTHIPSFTLQLL